jgi:hypothetical protein
MLLLEQYLEATGSEKASYAPPQGLKSLTIIRERKERYKVSILYKDLLYDSDPYQYGVGIFLMQIIKHNTWIINTTISQERSRSSKSDSFLIRALGVM